VRAGHVRRAGGDLLRKLMEVKREQGARAEPRGDRKQRKLGMGERIPRAEFSERIA
jgi:hypothetical protein